ncbi:hypothetical protein C8Q73DRAFT_134336 [Cubamyces lactineus]|nr:hypothetical protein C8Q73DRAFT_134336 [Cubamyces lactineus]
MEPLRTRPVTTQPTHPVSSPLDLLYDITAMLTRPPVVYSQQGAISHLTQSNARAYSRGASHHAHQRAACSRPSTARSQQQGPARPHTPPTSPVSSRTASRLCRLPSLPERIVCSDTCVFARFAVRDRQRSRAVRSWRCPSL